ncbi:MAG: hypothetical protein IT366_16395 [Candidatus Hydrogenedentes bacterium]|nr:hypothetical protein [Candidatus Hydrogenedentota bacterium]
MADIVRPLERIREIAKAMEGGVVSDLTSAYSSIAAMVDIVQGEVEAKGNDAFIREKINVLLYHARCLAKLDDDKARPGFQHLNWLLAAQNEILQQCHSLDLIVEVAPDENTHTL